MVFYIRIDLNKNCFHNKCQLNYFEPYIMKIYDEFITLLNKYVILIFLICGLQDSMLLQLLSQYMFCQFRFFITPTIVLSVNMWTRFFTHNHHISIVQYSVVFFITRTIVLYNFSNMLACQTFFRLRDMNTEMIRTSSIVSLAF